LRRDSNCTRRQKREGKFIFLLLVASGARIVGHNARVPEYVALSVWVPIEGVVIDDSCTRHLAPVLASMSGVAPCVIEHMRRTRGIHSTASHLLVDRLSSPERGSSCPWVTLRLMIPSCSRSDWEPCEDACGQAEAAAGRGVAVPERSVALAEIARNHHSALVRFLALRTGSAEDAKEIVQEAYAKALALDRPDIVSFQVGYLWRIAANLAIDRKRQRLARARLASVALQPTDRCSPSAESVVESRERLAIVQKAIAELPPRCRQAFMLRIVEGYRFAQVGREMGISERMAKVHVARAMEYLQDCLDSAGAVRKRA